MNFQKIAAVSLLMLCWSVCTGRSADADTSYIASYGSRFAGKVFVNDDFLSIMRDFGNSCRIFVLSCIPFHEGVPSWS